MFRFAKWLLCVAVIAGAIMIGTASPARADTEIMLTISDNVGDSTTATYDFDSHSFVNSNGALGNTTGTAPGTFFTLPAPAGQQELAFTGTVGAYTVTLSDTTSNAPGGASAFVNSTNSTVTGNGTGLTFETSAELFSSPSSPPAPALVLSTDSSTTGLGLNSPNMATYTGSAGTALEGNQYASASGSYAIGPTGSGSGSSISSSPFNATSYTLTNTQTLGSGGLALDISGKTEVTAVPEPASVMTFLSAVPFFGLGAWLRRRKQAV